MGNDVHELETRFIVTLVSAGCMVILAAIVVCSITAWDYLKPVLMYFGWTH